MLDGVTADQAQQIEEALVKGQRILAIKLYREATGVGLKEAKDIIFELADQLLRQDPAKYAALARSGKGCAGMVALVVAGMAAAAGVAGVALWRVVR